MLQCAPPNSTGPTLSPRRRFEPPSTVLSPIEEGFDVPLAINKAVAILQAHPEINAALSSTGGGATVWTHAARESGRSLVIVGMNYTRENLDLVRSGEVFAVVAQPLWEESFAAAELLDQIRQGMKIPWWTKLPAPIIDRANVRRYDQLLGEIEESSRH
jgi:ribose transport system substrate-binding protein